MKTNIFKSIVGAMMLACMVSCGDAEDLLQVSTNIPMPLSTGSCADAKYLSESRAWDVNTSGTAFEGVGRIELTASGNYMFLPGMDSFTFEELDEDSDWTRSDTAGMPSGQKAPGKKMKSSFKRINGKNTRSQGYYPAGTFTKISDNEYELSDLGRLVVNSDGTLTLYEGGEVYDFSATSVSGYQLDELTRRFSRTWEVVQVERAYYSDNKLVRKRFLSQEEIESEYVRAVVVTQFGAFVRYEWDGYLDGYGVWKWEIPEKQLFQFVFKDEDYYETPGYEQVYFYDDYAMFLEYADEYDSGQYYEIVDVLKTRSAESINL